MTIAQKQTEINKEETVTTEPPTTSTSKELAKETDKTEDNKEEAIAYYDERIAYWGKLWENFEIDDDTYRKNCPYRI